MKNDWERNTGEVGSVKQVARKRKQYVVKIDSVFTSHPRGNKVDGLPRASTFLDTTRREIVPKVLGGYG